MRNRPKPRSAPRPSLQPVKKKEPTEAKPVKIPTIKLNKFYEVRGTLFSGYNAGTHVSIILTEVLFTDHFTIEKLLGVEGMNFYGISTSGKPFQKTGKCTKSVVQSKINYSKSRYKKCHKRGEWELEIVPKRSWYGPEYFRSLDDAERYIRRIEKLCGYTTKRTEFLITQSHLNKVMDKFTGRTTR